MSSLAIQNQAMPPLRVDEPPLPKSGGQETVDTIVNMLELLIKMFPGLKDRLQDILEKIKNGHSDYAALTALVAVLSGVLGFVKGMFENLKFLPGVKEILEVVGHIEDGIKKLLAWINDKPPAPDPRKSEQVNLLKVLIQDIANLDLQAAMFLVQAARANLMENQLKLQLANINDKNMMINAVNELMNQIKAIKAGLKDPKDTWQLTQAVQAQLKALGVTHLDKVDLTTDPPPFLNGAQLDALADALKTKADALNSTQQMDMARMQSLGNKRNEALDLLTNTLKNMHDTLNNVIGNLR